MHVSGKKIERIAKEMGSSSYLAILHSVALNNFLNLSLFRCMFLFSFQRSCWKDKQGIYKYLCSFFLCVERHLVRDKGVLSQGIVSVDFHWPGGNHSLP